MDGSLISKIARAAGARQSAFSSRGQVTVLETRQGLGGRVHALDSLLPGKGVEAGDELIGLNHPTWMAHAKQFGLSLSELPEGDEADSPILINGRRLVG